MTDRRRTSFAQNGEDIRVWRAFRHLDPTTLRFVDVGANEPRHLSISASLSDDGWRGLLIEADPVLAAALRVHRPLDTVVEVAAADGDGELVFHRVPGTGLGTLDATEAAAAAERGFAVETVRVRTRALDDILDDLGSDPAWAQVHFMSIDVEGAEATVLQGLSLHRHRPWTLCVEAVLPGTSTPSHHGWEPRLLAGGYRLVAFDGVNRWYVADEHADLAADLSIPFNAIDAGEHGWVLADQAQDRARSDRARIRRAWARELILHDIAGEVPRVEYERQIAELRGALVSVEGSRTFRYARTAARVGKAVVFRARRTVDRLPGPVRSALVRARHLRLVRATMVDLTDPAYLGRPPADQVSWITPDGLPPGPAGGFALEAFTEAEATAARAWLDAGPYDTDDLLDRRTDNHGDELGRTAAALRERLAIADRPASPRWAGGGDVLFDARCLQTPAFGTRGIGRFARAALTGVRDAIGDDRLVLLVDRGLEDLPSDLAGEARQVSEVTERAVPQFGALVQPSPMTASTLPYLPLLHSQARKVAVVFDFIPMHYPTVYLRHFAARAEYGAALDALRHYDHFVCISHLARAELGGVLGRPAEGPQALDAAVAWPADVLPGGVIVTGTDRTTPAESPRTGPIVLMTGDEPRKNTFGGLAAIGAATAGDPGRDVAVIGMAGQADRVHHWSIAAAMRPGEARTIDRISDEDLHELLASASLIVVPSFDEGLSLPVIEALRAGAPVVAADIPAHRELIGAGSYLADPADPKALARAIRRHAAESATWRRQSRHLLRHEHQVLEEVIGELVAGAAKAASVDLPQAAVHVAGRGLRIGIGTPWAPQRSGVADFSTTTTIELARLADVTVYATAGADVAATVPADVRIAAARIEQVLERGSGEDVFVSVVGNSHFHLPFLAAIERTDAVVVSHDTRLVELYLALRGRGGVEQLMLRGTGERSLNPPLDEQIDDMRLLQNAGFWEVARRARALVLHTPTAADQIQAQTGIRPYLLPFANQRAPRDPVTEAARAEARRRLGFDAGPFAGTVHLASFGFLDTRTKQTDVVIEAAGWLSQWGHRVSLHLAGSAGPADVAALTARAEQVGIANFRVTGFLDDADFRDYLLAVDLGVQLRISPLLGVSGPLSDLAAYGTPAVASRGLAADVDTPGYVHRLPDDVSPILVAEAIEQTLAAPMPFAEREQLRREYLAAKSPARYAEQLFALLSQTVGR